MIINEKKQESNDKKPMSSSSRLGFVTYGTGTDSKSSIATMVARGLTRSVTVNRDGRLYASDAGLCQRKAVLEATTDGITIDTASSRGYYALGNAIEDLVMDGLFDSNSLLFKQYRLPDVGINLGGYIDGVILISDKMRVLEVKSCGALPSHPKPHHAAQAYIYSAITGLPASLLYFSRSVAKFDGSVLMREFNLEEQITEKRNSLYRAVVASIAIKLKVIPDISSHIMSSKVCKEAFCPFVSVCWDGAQPDNEWRYATPSEMLEISNQAYIKTEEIMDPDAVDTRRTGMLKHLELHGNSLAKDILRHKSWDTLV